VLINYQFQLKLISRGLISKGVSFNESTQPLREAILSNDSKSVKEAVSADNNQEDWLVRQRAQAAENLKKRPLERRGPFVVSDEDLNQDFRL
jgi:hypothetical protein